MTDGNLRGTPSLRHPTRSERQRAESQDLATLPSIALAAPSTLKGVAPFRLPPSHTLTLMSSLD